MLFSVVLHQAFQSVLDQHRLGDEEMVMMVGGVQLRLRLWLRLRVATATAAATAAATVAATAILVTAWMSTNRR